MTIVGATYTASFNAGPWVILLALAGGAVEIAGLWKVFTKADQPGWAAIIPIYNFIVLLRIVHRPIWWLVFFLVPFANVVTLVVIIHDLSRKFGQNGPFAVGLILLGWVFFPILGFGSSRYLGYVDSTNIRRR